MTDLLDDRLHRRHDAILAALDVLVEHWDGAHDPPKPPGSGRRTPPRSRPPVSSDVLSALDAAWRDLRSWGQLVMEERDLTLGPRDDSGPALALFLARHADWLSRHEAADDARRELARHAHRIEAMAKGRRVRRVILPGGCPQMTLDDNAVTIGPCPGLLVAVVHHEEELLPAVIRCDADREHAWTPSEWPALGRKLGRVNHSAAVDLVKAITGRALLRHTAG